MEVGQGLVTVCQQIARSVLGISSVAVVWDNTSEIGSAGSTSASRQTQMTGGAVHAAAVGLLEKILVLHDGDELNDDGVFRNGSLVATIDQVCADGVVDHWVNFEHPPTYEVDEKGQGDAHAGWAIAAHRAMVDVDEELGLVRVIHIDTAQDVGRILNPSAAIGQIEGGNHARSWTGCDGRGTRRRWRDPQPQLHRLPTADLPRRTLDQRHVC